MSGAEQRKGPRGRRRAAAGKGHAWQFRARFRRHGFGWRSQPAIRRVKEAISEIKKVAGTDPLTAAEGAVLFLERVSPALERLGDRWGELCGSRRRGRTAHRDLPDGVEPGPGAARVLQGGHGVPERPGRRRAVRGGPRSPGDVPPGKRRPRRPEAPPDGPHSRSSGPLDSLTVLPSQSRDCRRSGKL